MEKISVAKRFNEIDFARVVPLIFLPIVHCYEELSSYQVLSPSAVEAGEIWLYLCMMGPSVFMIVLGMNIAFSSHSSPKQLAHRGLITLGLYFALNLARFTIPWSLVYIFRPNPILKDAIFFTLCVSDILMFAAISFLYFSLMKKLKASPIVILAVSLVLLCAGTLLDTEMPLNIFSSFLGNFYRTNSSSSFPALVWLVYPSIGFIIGNCLKRADTEQERRTLYNRLALIGIAMLAVICVTLNAHGIDPLLVSATVVNDNRTDLFNIIMDTALAFIWFDAAYYIYAVIVALRLEKLKNAIIGFSFGITSFYVVQWIIVGWTEVIVGALFYEEYCLKYSHVLMIALVIAAVSVLLTKPVNKMLGKLR